MTTRRARTRLLALSALTALTFTAAACGGDDDDDSAATDAPAASQPVTTEPMTSEAMTTEPMASEPMDGAMSPSGPACGAVPTDGEGSFEGMADDPAATAASNNPELSTLVTAVGAADLVDTLNGPGPFTIFAPVNSAFEKIPAADLEAVLADTDLLTSILTYHVLPEQLDSAALAADGPFTTVNGAEVTVEMDGDTLTINGGEATVVCADVPTANATVYLIDTVLMPPADDAAPAGAMAPSGPACGAVPTDGEGSFEGMADDPAATAASNNPELSTLVTAVGAAGLVDTLNGPGPFTIFAPVNSAFAKIPAADLDAVLADPTGALTDVLTLHVVSGEALSSADLVAAGTVESLNGELTVAQDGDAVTVDAGSGPATVVCADVPVANGTVHLIDTVLMPAG